MKNLLFVIWVLGYPVASKLSDYLGAMYRRKMGIEIKETTLGYLTGLFIEFFIYIGFAIYFFGK